MRLIDADALLEYKFPNGFSGWDEKEVVYVVYEEDILSAPTVEAEPIRHGHWTITDQDVMGEKKLMCSYCTSVTSSFGFPNYCFNCGTKMDEVTHNEAD